MSHTQQHTIEFETRIILPGAACPTKKIPFSSRRHRRTHNSSRANRKTKIKCFRARDIDDGNTTHELDKRGNRVRHTHTHIVGNVTRS